MDYILKHPHASNAEVLLALKVASSTVDNARRRLRDQGYSLISNADRITPKALTEQAVEEAAQGAMPLDMDNMSGLLDAIDEESAEAQIGDNATPEEMKKILTRILRNKGLDPRIRVMAIAQKQKLDYDTVGRHELGPGEPLSKDDAVDRLTMLLQACGPEITHLAIENAFKSETSVPKEAEVVDTPDIHTEEPAAAHAGDSNAPGSDPHI